MRDEALLDSALARSRQIAGYEPEADIVRLAAALTFAIVRNHPFVDGNKRTGFVTGVLFLELNGYRFTASEESAAFAVMGLAGGELDEAGYEAFLGRTQSVSEIIPGSALPASGPLPSLQSQPAVITAAGERAAYRFLEFFTARIRNPHTRRSYARAVGDFCAWLEARNFGP